MMRLGEVLDLHPDLGMDGFEPMPKRRDEMLDEVEQFIKARDWIAKFPKVRKINNGYSSYGLKHLAEPEIRYVSNGVFIAAAISAGFTVRRDGLNGLFNISMRELRRR